MIDLHIHTTGSDGEYSPTETMQIAKKAGVTIIAVTDHDSVSGVREAKEEAERLQMRFLSGIEINVKCELVKEMHMLGYGIDPTNQELLDFCRRNEENRTQRTFRLIEYLNKCGVVITLEDVLATNDGKASGRPHFGKTLMKLGYVSTMQEAFDRYLSTPDYYKYVERPKPSMQEGIDVIHHAGGVAVLAHPHQLYLENDALDDLLKSMKAMGLDGIEARYSRHTTEQTKFYLYLAEKYQLLTTCGSDFHGPHVKPDILPGSGLHNSLCFEDTSIVEKLKQAIQAKNGK